MNSGSFYDVLKHMEATLNFTTRIYRRKSGGWGMPIIYPNKSIHLSPGMVNDLKDGSADMIGAEFVVTYFFLSLSSRHEKVIK